MPYGIAWHGMLIVEEHYLFTLVHPLTSLTSTAATTHNLTYTFKSI